nr:pyridoxamine 5'-phosphate oxidase family protein [Acuticoccus kandeliae]
MVLVSRRSAHTVSRKWGALCEKCGKRHDIDSRSPILPFLTGAHTVNRPAFDAAIAAQLARNLVHTAQDAAFGTLDASGAPNVSHVAVATLVDGSPVLLISDLAVHTQNVKRDNRASLLFVAAEGESADTNTRARVTLNGRLVPLEDVAAGRDRFLRRHKDAAGYIDFADFRLMRFVVEGAHLVAGFGRITDLSPEAILAPADMVAGLAKMDAGGCAHMNEDHLDALEVMAVAIAGGPAGHWTAVALDPQGIDMTDGTRTVRVEYDAPVADGLGLRTALKTLADRGRAMRQSAA